MNKHEPMQRTRFMTLIKFYLYASAFVVSLSANGSAVVREMNTTSHNESAHNIRKNVSGSNKIMSKCVNMRR